MSKDNTVVIIPCFNGKFYVKNIQAEDNLTYEADVVPVGGDIPFYNLDCLISWFIKLWTLPYPHVANQSKVYEHITTPMFLNEAIKYSHHPIVANSKDDALKIANVMCENEKRDMGWGPEYGTNIYKEIVPFDLEVMRNIMK